MDLSDEYLNLPTYTIGSLEESSERVFIDGAIPVSQFVELNDARIFGETLTSEKAVYIALQLGSSPLADATQPLKEHLYFELGI